MEFHFKYFSVSQINSALKVGTDAMVLGALCTFPEKSTILDIGAGTGVLSLIVAQRFSPIKVVAVEPDISSCRDAEMNFTGSPFSTELQLLPTKVQEFLPGYLFDGIISNPPYFIDSTKSGMLEKDNARHQTELSLQDLFMSANRLLSETGIFWIILPFDQLQLSVDLAESFGLYPETITEIQGKPDKPVRTVLSFRKEKRMLHQNLLVIRTNSGAYSEEYISLTKELHGKSLQ